MVSKPHFAVSCQHYSFAVNAFVDVIREFDAYQYDFTIREEQTHEIIEDVTNLKSELGVIYLSSKNTEVLSKMLKRNELEFTELFTATPHVFICDSHPLASKKSITMDDLQDYPYLTYEQESTIHSTFRRSLSALLTAERISGSETELHFLI